MKLLLSESCQQAQTRRSLISKRTSGEDSALRSLPSSQSRNRVRTRQALPLLSSTDARQKAWPTSRPSTPSEPPPASPAPPSGKTTLPSPCASTMTVQRRSAPGSGRKRRCWSGRPRAGDTAARQASRLADARSVLGAQHRSLDLLLHLPVPPSFCSADGRAPARDRLLRGHCREHIRIDTVRSHDGVVGLVGPVWEEARALYLPRRSVPVGLSFRLVDQDMAHAHLEGIGRCILCFSDVSCVRCPSSMVTRLTTPDDTGLSEFCCRSRHRPETRLVRTAICRPRHSLRSLQGLCLPASCTNPARDHPGWPPTSLCLRLSRPFCQASSTASSHWVPQRLSSPSSGRWVVTRRQPACSTFVADWHMWNRPSLPNSSLTPKPNSPHTGAY